MQTIKLILPGKPLSKDNHKEFNKNGKYFLSDKFKRYEQNIRYEARAQLPHNFEMFVGDVAIIIDFVFPDHKRCDLLNAPKSVCDALNKIVWKDDRQIVKAFIKVSYDKDNPRIEMFVREEK